MGSDEQPLVVGRMRRLGQEVEETPSPVVDHDQHQVDVVVVEEAIGVVEH